MYHLFRIIYEKVYTLFEKFKVEKIQKLKFEIKISKLFKMFQIKLEKDNFDDEDFIDVVLTLTINGIKIEMSPENEKCILDVDIEAIKGCIDCNPGNGDFSLDWNESQIDFCCGKYGNGCGGGLLVSVPATQETLTSLKVALREWKNAVAEN